MPPILGIRTQGQLNQRDFVSAIYLNMRPRRSLAVVGIVLVVLVVIAEGLEIVWWLRGRYPGIQPLVLGACSTAIAIQLGILFPRRARRIFRQYKGASVPYSFSLEKEGIHFESQYATGVVPWDHIHHWREGKNHFLLYQADTFAHVLPKRFFSEREQVTAFRTALEHRLGPAT